MKIYHSNDIQTDDEYQEFEKGGKRCYRSCVNNKIKRVYQPLTLNDLKEELKSDTRRYVSDRDVEQFMVKQCFACFKSCERCVYRELNKKYVAPRALENFVYLQLQRTGRCWIPNKKPTTEMLQELSYFGINVEYEQPTVIKGGCVLVVRNNG